MLRVEEIAEEITYADSNELVAAERIAEAIENLAAAVYDLTDTISHEEVGDALRGIAELPEVLAAGFDALGDSIEGVSDG